MTQFTIFSAVVLPSPAHALSIDFLYSSFASFANFMICLCLPHSSRIISKLPNATHTVSHSRLCFMHNMYFSSVISRKCVIILIMHVHPSPSFPLILAPEIVSLTICFGVSIIASCSNEVFGPCTYDRSFPWDRRPLLLFLCLSCTKMPVFLLFQNCYHQSFFPSTEKRLLPKCERSL